MSLRDVFKQKRVFSLEIFPPKRNGDLGKIYATIEALARLRPDFISVTYGAGGCGSCGASIEIAKAIRERHHIRSIAHLPAMGLKASDVDVILLKLKEAGITNILALRGDRPQNPDFKPGDFRYASELITYIRSRGDFEISAACYPETHIEARSAVEDIRNLKLKVDAGAQHLISQLFFDNELFYAFREKCAIAGIEVPIEAGIMPVVNVKQIQRMVTLCKVSLPKKFLRIMSRYENKPEALRDAGIAYSIDQIVDLITNGADGIHLYTMNNASTALRIYEAVHNLISIDDLTEEQTII